MNELVSALESFDASDGDGPTLYVGGRFTVSPKGDSFLAKWQGCLIAPQCDFADLNCDGVVDGADL
jgi:hypothetical protein